jgi:hypothetical protein
MAINNWQAAPLWVLLVPLVVVRISFVLSPCPFMYLGKMLNERLRSCLNFTGTPHVAVRYVFVELLFRSY